MSLRSRSNGSPGRSGMSSGTPLPGRPSNALADALALALAFMGLTLWAIT